MTETAVEIPGYVTGTWTVDPVHSEVSFVVRHMMVSKVRGRFDKFDLTLRGITRPVAFRLEVNGFGPDPYGGTRAGFSATAEINRNEWNVSYNGPIPGAGTGMVLSDKATINLEIEAVLDHS